MIKKKVGKAKSGAKSSKGRKVKIGRIPRTTTHYFAMSESAQDKWNRAAHVVAKMRKDRISLTRAAREFDIDPTAVIDLAKPALRKKRNGRYIARKTDTLLRVLVIPSSDGPKEIAVRDSKTASTIAQYSDAVQKYLRTGDARPLKKFKRTRLKDADGKRVRLLTDTAELNRLGSAGVLSFESLYANVG